MLFQLRIAFNYVSFKPIVKVHRASAHRAKAGLKVEDMSSPTSTPTRAPRVTYNNSSLPPGTVTRWTKVFVPMWMQHLGTVQSGIWDMTDNAYLEEAQSYWDDVFPGVPHILALRGDAVFAVVRTTLIHTPNY